VTQVVAPTAWQVLVGDLLRLQGVLLCRECRTLTEQCGKGVMMPQLCDARRAAARV
jgi:hypothetical protein